MSDPFVGEIRMFAGTFAPVGWLACNGQILPISQYDVLFSLIGTTYGGDGQSTFALPNLQSRVLIHQGTGLGLSSYTLGQTGGTETVTLTANQLPVHSHQLPASASTGSGQIAAGNQLATANVNGTTANAYQSAAPTLAMAASMIGNTGGSQPHDNIMPYLTVNFIMATEGIYPSQT